MSGILEQVRAEGYKAGRADGDFTAAQERMCQMDEAREQGRRDAEQYAPRKMTWWLFGLLCGAAPFLPWSSIL